jgi:polar amino acid transport system substrate-binding protein
MERSLMVKAMFRALVLALGMSAAASPAAAEQLKLVTGNDYLPFADADLPKGGMATAIVRAVYARMDQSISVDFLPWKRGYLKTRHGTYAATFPYVRTDERASQFHYSKPILEIVQKPVKMADSAFSAETAAELAGTTYCLPNGYAPARIVARMTENERLDRRQPLDMTKCFHMLERGRVEFIPMSVLLAEYTAQKLFDDSSAVTFTDLVLERTTLHVIFPKDQPRSRERLAAFNAAFDKLRESGGYQHIIDRYRANASEPSG